MDKGSAEAELLAGNSCLYRTYLLSVLKFSVSPVVFFPGEKKVPSIEKAWWEVVFHFIKSKTKKSSRFFPAYP